MSTRVVLDGVPNGPLSFEDSQAFLGPFLEALGGLDPADVESLTINRRKLSAKVAVRNKRGRKLVGSWAHVSRSIDFPIEES